MKDETMLYEPPALAEVGDFAELTQITGHGDVNDNPWFWALWD
jgi:hypothetical protein